VVRIRKSTTGEHQSGHVYSSGGRNYKEQRRNPKPKSNVIRLERRTQAAVIVYSRIFINYMRSRLEMSMPLLLVQIIFTLSLYNICLQQQYLKEIKATFHAA
jgi:hypothetical protein